MNIGPKDNSEKEIFAIEGFRVDVQHRIYKLMRDRGVTQRDLARRLGLSESRVSQIFSDECNLTIRLLAKIFFALDDECFISSRRLEELNTAWSPAKAAGHAPETCVARVYRLDHQKPRYVKSELARSSGEDAEVSSGAVSEQTSAA